nr:WcaF family extracellular polysaccharide biosynthesis acetyltransferase [Pedobacter panaciterrae]
MHVTKLKKGFDKKEFKIGASYLKLICWYFTSLLFFRSGLIPFSNVLVFILRLFGAKIGTDVRIKPHVHIKYPWKLHIGDHSWLADCYIENLDYVIIGNNVCISQQCMLLTGNHNYKLQTFDLITQPVILEDGVWICARAIVCPGVTAKSHSVLTAGSVATKNLQAYFIYTGLPAVKSKIRKSNN